MKATTMTLKIQKTQDNNYNNTTVITHNRHNTHQPDLYTNSKKHDTLQ